MRNKRFSSSLTKTIGMNGWMKSHWAIIEPKAVKQTSHMCDRRNGNRNAILSSTFSIIPPHLDVIFTMPRDIASRSKSFLEAISCAPNPRELRDINYHINYHIFPQACQRAFQWSWRQFEIIVVSRCCFSSFRDFLQFKRKIRVQIQLILCASQKTF